MARLEAAAPPDAPRLAARFLRDGVVFAALRNFRRDHIQEERDWIWRHKCKEDVETCADLIRQWAAYVDEQPRPDWEVSTSALEGCLLLQDLQAPLAQLIFCNWWNEYVRYGERDQLALSYVLLRMGLTHEGGATTRGATAPTLDALPPEASARRAAHRHQARPPRRQP